MPKYQVRMPEFQPTSENRNMVQALAGFGIAHTDIARIIINPRTGNGISLTVLLKNFPEELASGKTRAIAQVAGFLFKKATGQLGDDAAAVSAAIFWMKCQARWKPERDLEDDRQDGSGNVDITVRLVRPPPIPEDFMLDITPPKGHADD